MNWITILYIVIVILAFLVGLLINNYLPSYVTKKAENLATKQDIADITRKTEEVQKDFNEKFELFTSDVRFKYDFQYKRYSELYCKLYAVIIQSEYIRSFLNLNNDTEVTFEQAPFLEICRTKKAPDIVKAENGDIVSKPESIELIRTPITEFNKKLLSDSIIENGSLASPELLKCAVSYRFAYEYYSGNANGVITEEIRPLADKEEVRLIGKMVNIIVTEYNELRRDLKLTYDDEELRTGITYIHAGGVPWRRT